MARTVTWKAANGDEIAFSEAPPYMMSKFYPGTPAGAAEAARGARTHGQKTYSVAMEPLTPSLAGSIQAAGHSADEAQKNLDALRRRLQSALDPLHFGELVFRNYENSYRLPCRPVTGAEFGEAVGGSLKFDAEWVSDVPYWTEDEEKYILVGLIKKLWTFPWAIAPTVFGSIESVGTIKNPTNIEIFPKITVSDTASSKITVGNATTGAQVTISRAIAAGQRLEIDMAAPSAALVDPSGEAADVIHWTTVDSTFPWGAVPGDNEIYSAVDDPELSPVILVAWRVPEVGL